MHFTIIIIVPAKKHGKIFLFFLFHPSNTDREACPDGLVQGGATNCSLSLPFVWVRLLVRACDNVARDMWLGRVLPVSSTV